MSDIATKLQYLNTTKGKIKDVINKTNANIDNQTTFRNYAQSLYNGYINVLKNRDTLLDNMNIGTSTGSISDGANLPVYEDKMSKLSTQDTTTGKNLFDISKLVVGGTYEYFKFKEESDNSTYTLSIKLKDGGTQKNMYIGFANNGELPLQNFEWLLNSGSIDGTSHEDGFKSKSNYKNNIYNSYIVVFKSSGNTLQDLFDNYDIQLVKGEYQPYEPYTNGPSPNPNYPQEVKTVKGYRNLFNINGDVNTRYNGTTGTNNTVSGNDLTTTTNLGNYYPYGQKIYVGAGNTVYISLKFKSITYSSEPSTSSNVSSCSIYNDNTTTGAKTIVFTYNELETNKSISFTATTDYIYVTFGRYSIVNTATFTDIMVTTKNNLPYVPYGSNYIYTTITGKNLNSGLRLGYYDATNGNYVYNAGATCSKSPIKINSSNYIFSQNGSAITGYVYEFNSSDTFIGRTYIGTSGIYTPSSNASYFNYAFKNGSTSEAPLDGLFQIEQGNEATTYEAYKEKIITIPLNNNEICGIGNYKDELIVDKNGNAKLVKKIGKVVLDGSENWNLGSASSNDYYIFQKSERMNNANEPTIYSNNFIGGGYISASTTIDYEGIFYNDGALTNSYLRIWIEGSRLSEKSATAFKTWLSTHNTDVYYVLATSQLIDLNYNVDLTLYEGTNTITNSEDMDMSIKFIKSDFE